MAKLYISQTRLQLKRKCSLVEKLNLIAAYLLAPTATIFQLAFVFKLHWLSPCKATIVRYILFSELIRSIVESSGYQISNKLLKLGNIPVQSLGLKYSCTVVSIYYSCNSNSMRIQFFQLSFLFRQNQRFCLL